MLKYVGMMCVCCLLTAQSVDANKNAVKRMGLGIGISAIRSRDDLASPFTYSGTGIPKAFVFTTADSVKREETMFLLDQAHLATNITTGFHKTDLFRLRGRYEIYRLWHPNIRNRIDLFIGGIFDGFVTVRDLSYRQNTTEKFAEITLSLHPAIGLQFKLPGQSTLFYQVSTPILSLMSRNHYSTKLTKKWQMVSLNHFQGIDHRLTWAYKLSNRMGVWVVYWGQFYRHTKPRTLQMGVDQLSAVVFWEF